MSEFKTNWTENQFKAYVLLYASKSNYKVSDVEKEYIQKIVSSEEYKIINREIENDNDYQSIQKIIYNIEKFKYDKKDVSRLIQEIKELFWADGVFDVLEENMLLILKKIIS